MSNEKNNFVQKLLEFKFKVDFKIRVKFCETWLSSLLNEGY